MTAAARRRDAGLRRGRADSTRLTGGVGSPRRRSPALSRSTARSRPPMRSPSPFQTPGLFGSARKLSRGEAAPDFSTSCSGASVYVCWRPVARVHPGQRVHERLFPGRSLLVRRFGETSPSCLRGFSCSSTTSRQRRAGHPGDPASRLCATARSARPFIFLIEPLRAADADPASSGRHRRQAPRSLRGGGASRRWSGLRSSPSHRHLASRWSRARPCHRRALAVHTCRCCRSILATSTRAALRTAPRHPDLRSARRDASRYPCAPSRTNAGRALSSGSRSCAPTAARSLRFAARPRIPPPAGCPRSRRVGASLRCARAGRPWGSTLAWARIDRRYTPGRALPTSSRASAIAVTTPPVTLCQSCIARARGICPRRPRAQTRHRVKKKKQNKNKRYRRTGRPRAASPPGLPQVSDRCQDTWQLARLERLIN